MGIPAKCYGTEADCKRIVQVGGNDYCPHYTRPAAHWRGHNCPMATHVQSVQKVAAKVRAGQQKQKKK